MDLETFFYTSFLFWVILDPLGNIPLLITLIAPFDAKKQKKIIFRELVFALIIMLLFLFFGIGFFSLIKVDTASLSIAGGILLCLLAIRMIFAKPHKNEPLLTAKEPFIFPLAIPAIAGPGALSMISLYGGVDFEHKLAVLSAILLAWLANIPILLLALPLKRALGENGLLAIQRLFGFIIILLAVQLVSKGILQAFP